MTQAREEGYYWIIPAEGEDWVIGYWYQGVEDVLGRRSAGYFDCSNYWNQDYQIVYSALQVGERLIKG